MRTRFLFFIFFLISLSGFGQARKIVIGKDTLVTITPSDLKTINKGLTELEFGKEIIKLKDSIIVSREKEIRLKDSIISKSDLELSIKDSIISHERTIRDIEKKKFKKEKRDSSIRSGGIGIAIGVLLSVILL